MTPARYLSPQPEVTHTYGVDWCRARAILVSALDFPIPVGKILDLHSQKLIPVIFLTNHTHNSFAFYKLL